jgi:DNA-binding NarL/FixJ family response regulator
MPERSDPLRVAIADDSALFRSGLAMQLESAALTVTDVCGSAAELMARIPAGLPDAVILDMRMPPTFTHEGLTAAATIREQYPNIGVLVLSTYTETRYAMTLLSAGAARMGYLLKDRVANAATLRDALSRIVAGECVVDPEIIQRLIARQPPNSVLAQLTDRERDVLRLLAEGRSNSGIGQQLFLSERTIETHIAGIFDKLGLSVEPHSNRRVQAVITWLRTA